MAGGLSVMAAIVVRPFEAARSWTFDSYQRQWPAERGVSQTVVVEIDEESIHRFGQWPWPRELLADLPSRVSGARSVGIDVLMPDADRLSPDDLVRRHHIETPALRDALLALPHSNAALAQAIRGQPTVLAMTVHDHGIGVPATLEPVREQGDLATATGYSEPR